MNQKVRLTKIQEMVMDNQSIEISGIGMMTPKGNTMLDILNNIYQENTIKYKNRGTVVRLGQGVSNDCIAGVSKKKHTRLSRMVIDTIGRCLSNAGIDEKEISESDTGIITASYFGCLDAIDGITRSIYKNNSRNSVNPIEFSKATHSFPAAMATIKYHLKGPVVSLVSTQNAGLDAIQLAINLIRSGKANNMFVIGYEEIPPLAQQYLVDVGILGTNTQLNVPACEGCIALLLQKNISKNKFLNNAIKAKVIKVRANFFSEDNVIDSYRNNIVNVSNYLDKTNKPVLIYHGINNIDDFESGNKIIDNMISDGIVSNAVNIEEKIGNYFGAGPLIELGLAVASINYKKSQWLFDNENINEQDKVNLIVNSADKRGNISSAAVIAYQ
jgi:hypothetical protein